MNSTKLLILLVSCDIQLHFDVQYAYISLKMAKLLRTTHIPIVSYTYKVST